MSLIPYRNHGKYKHKKQNKGYTYSRQLGNSRSRNIVYYGFGADMVFHHYLRMRTEKQAKNTHVFLDNVRLVVNRSTGCMPH